MSTPMNPVVHFEMPYRDRVRAARFYTAAFGWQTQQLGPEMGDYLLVTTALPGHRPAGVPDAPFGAIGGGLYPLPADGSAAHPSIVIAVDSLSAAMAQVAEAGGQVMGAPMDIPGVGSYVAFVDTEGNRNSMLQPLMGAAP
jgi:uncharacterized protein